MASPSKIPRVATTDYNIQLTNPETAAPLNAVVAELPPPAIPPDFRAIDEGRLLFARYIFTETGQRIDIRSFYRAKDATKKHYQLDVAGRSIVRPGKGINLSVDQAISTVRVLVHMLSDLKFDTKTILG